MAEYDDTDYSGYGNLSSADLYNLFSNDPTIDYSGYGDLQGPELAKLAAEMASNAGSSKFSLKDIADLAKRVLSGKGTASEYGNLATILGGLYGASRSNAPTILNPGYRGGIPQLTATRTMLTEPPAGRRPGSGGINYGGDVVYARTGQNLSAENAGISTPASQALGGTPTFTQAAAYDLPSLLALIQQVQQFQQAAGRPGVPTSSGITGAPITAGGAGSSGAPTTTSIVGPSAGAAPAGSQFVTGGGGASNYRGFSTKEEYDRAVAAKAAQDARERAELEAYQVTGKSGYGNAYAQAQADPSLLMKLHGESDADALMRLKYNIKDAEERQARREALAEKAKREGVTNQFAIDGQFAPAPVRPGYLAPTDSLAAETPSRIPVAPATPGTGGPGATPSGGGIQDLFQQVYGRPGSESEVQNISGLTPEQARNVLETSLANWKASQQAMHTAQPGQGMLEVAKGGLLPDGFVVPADVVSHLGNGSSEAGLKVLSRQFGARPIKGDGDGMSDSIPTTIGGKQPARVANEEAFISPSVVKRIGGGDTERGAKKLYAMMDRIRKARTGTTEQGKEINPEKFMPGGKVDRYQTGGSTTNNPSAGLASSSLADWIGPYVADMLAKGQALTESPYKAYTGPLTAGESPLQKLAFANAATFKPSAAIGQAASLAGGIASLAPTMRYTPRTTSFLGQPNISGLGTTAAPSAQSATTQTTAGSGPAGAAGASIPVGAGATSPAGAVGTNIPVGQTQPGLAGSIAQQYMNPFIESALNPQLRELTRQSDIARTSDAARLAKAGAFGGGRQAIMEAEGRRNLLEKQSDVLGQGYATAYDKAMAQFNADQARAAQEAQFGATFGLEGLRTGLQGAQTQGQLGGLETQYGLEGIKSLADLGKTQREIEAEGIAADRAQFEEARLNPFKMLQFQQSLLSGLPLASQSLYQPGQSNLQQFASGATTIQALLKSLGLIK